MNFELVFERRFSMAHRLISGSSEKCSIPHGHNEYIKIFLRHKQDDIVLDQNINMIQVFEKAKKKWHQFIDNHLDHGFQLNHNDPLIDYFKTQEPQKVNKLIITQGDPTTEMLCACLMSKLQVFLDEDKTQLVCNTVELQETPTNMVILKGDYAYRKHLKAGKEYWWNRADFLTNDL